MDRLRDEELSRILAGVRAQGYPLTVTIEEADALVECIRRIMESVPEDDQVFVRADFDLATSALCHPEATYGPESNTNISMP